MNISVIINHNREYMVELAEEMDVEQGQLWYEKGMEHLKSGNLSGVMECFRNALYFYPNFAEVHNTIGMIQFQIEKVATCQERLQIKFFLHFFLRSHLVRCLPV